MRKLCSHPTLVSSSLTTTDGLQQLHIEERNTHHTISDSGKLKVLMPLLCALSEGGHRTLVFSESLKMLDIIALNLDIMNMRYIRLDGSIKKGSERQRLVDSFNEDSACPVCLITTGVGGVGFTITGADRVIIYDPSWNPAVDDQVYLKRLLLVIILYQT